MLPRVNGLGWMDGNEDEGTGSWGHQNNGNNENHQHNSGMENKNDTEMGALSNFKSVLDVEDCYNMGDCSNYHSNNGGNMQNHHHDMRNISFPMNFNEANNNLLLQHVNSSSSAFNNLDPSQAPFFMPTKPAIPPLLSGLSNNNNGGNMQNHHHDMRNISFRTNFNEANNNLLLQPVDSSSSCSPSSAFNILDPSQVPFFMPPKSTIPPLLSGLSNNYNGGNMQNHHHDMRNISFPTNFNEANNNLLLQPVDSSSSCSPSSAFNNLDPSQVPFFMPPKPTFPPLLSGLSNNNNGSNMQNHHHDMRNISFPTNFNEANNNGGNMQNHHHGRRNISFPTNFNEANNNLLLLPFDSIGAQPSLYQKRAALRKNLADNGGNLGVLGNDKSTDVNEMSGRKRKFSNSYNLDDLSIDGSTLNYNSDDFLDNCTMVEDSSNNVGSSSTATSTVTGANQNGKKKGPPAKNLVAERRRRKKLNEKLYLLRSVVPKVTKLTSFSLLEDSTEYLKELTQTANDLHNELANSSLSPATSFYPMVSPTGQAARVEVRAREGRAVNIHMFSSRKPGLLLSTMRALDNLGLDVQQAVISCFDGFALDIFRAEQSNEGQDIHPEQIKAVLLDSAGFHGGMI